MKTKKFEKKLVLNKNTIDNLTNNELQKVKGGWAPTANPTDCALSGVACHGTLCIPCQLLTVGCQLP